MKKIFLIALAIFSASYMFAADGTALYKKCMSCHGAKAEKLPPGGNEIIKDWDADKIKHALTGYRAGTYGHKMKAVMKGQVGKFSDEDIDAISKHVSALNK